MPEKETRTQERRHEIRKGDMSKGEGDKRAGEAEVRRKIYERRRRRNEILKGERV